MIKPSLLFITFLLFIFSTNIMADTDPVNKGTFEFGIGKIAGLKTSGGGYFTSEYRHSFELYAGITPDLTIGYFPKERLCIGAGIFANGYAYFSRSSENSTAEIRVQPQLKYYIPLSEPFYFQIKALGGGSWKTDDQSNANYIQTHIGIGGGFTAMLLPELGLTIGLDCLVFQDEIKDRRQISDTGYSETDFSLGLSVFL